MNVAAPQFTDETRRYLSPVARLEHLDRLPLVELDLSEELASAMRRLERSGLVVQQLGGAPVRVAGGRRRIEVGGIEAFEDAFSMWRENDGRFAAVIAGRGNLGVRCDPSTLEDVVTFLEREYARRQVDRP